MKLDFIEEYNYRKNENEQEKDFRNYANPKTNKIDEEGMMKMGKVLEIDIYNDTFIIFFFFCCGMKSLEEVTKDQFKQGLTSFKSNNLSQVKRHILDTRGELMDITSTIFKKFYSFLYDINCIKKEKIIPYEVVEVYFKSFFADQFTFVNKFLYFIKEVKKLKGITKDQWECFLELLIKLGSVFPADYNCDDFYPSLFDEFYGWYVENQSAEK